MPNFKSEQLIELGSKLFEKGGTSANDGKVITEHLVNANLAGHDSHGFWRVPGYLDQIDKGEIDPKASPEIVNEGPAFAQIDGKGGYGAVTAYYGTELAIKKAKTSGISFVIMGNQGHIGRVGGFPEIAAKAGCSAVMWSGQVTRENPRGGVVPFGGKIGKLGTNPISMAFPQKSGVPILLDCATSTAAAGKIEVYRANNKLLPFPWILDRDGNPSNDPEKYHDGGAILPMGGLDGGHKGVGLSIMVSLFGGALPLFVNPNLDLDKMRKRQGCSIMVVDISKFAPYDDFLNETDQFINYIKDTPTMKGFSEIISPGEIEEKSRQSRLQNGIDFPDEHWRAVEKKIVQLGLDEECKKYLVLE